MWSAIDLYTQETNCKLILLGSVRFLINDPKLTPNTHIHIQYSYKALNATAWGNQRRCSLLPMRQSCGQPPNTNLHHVTPCILYKLLILQTTPNTGLRIATGCTQDSSIQHIHDEIKMLPLQEHLKQHSSQKYNIHHYYTN